MDTRDYRTEYKEILKSITPRKSIDQTQLPNLTFGYTTKDALCKLHSELHRVVEESGSEFARHNLYHWLKISLSFKSELSKMRWPSIMFMTAQTLIHFIVAYKLDIENTTIDFVGLQGFVLLAMLVFNLCVNLWDTRLRFEELLVASQRLLELIKDCSEDQELLERWKLNNNSKDGAAPSQYKLNLPSVHETITLRDELFSSLPDFLLVKGDIIKLYQGDIAPADCVSVDEPIVAVLETTHLNVSKTKQTIVNSIRRKSLTNVATSNTQSIADTPSITLKEGEVYKQSEDSESKDTKKTNQTSFDQEKLKLLAQFNHPKLKKANLGKNFKLLDTPYIKSLQLSLNQSHLRPVNSVEKECFIISRKCFETYVIPLLFILSTIVTAGHYVYLDLTDSKREIKNMTIAYLLLRPSLTIMPFLPWMFPFLWLIINAYGNARLLCCGQNQRNRCRKKHSKSHNPYNYSPEMENIEMMDYKNSNSLETPAGNSSDTKHHSTDCQSQEDINQARILKTFVELIKGKSGQVWRSANLLQVLGSLTSLCFINRAGILSWPMPSPEKVFILQKNPNSHSNHIQDHQSLSKQQDKKLFGEVQDLNMEQSTLSMSTNETKPQSVELNLESPQTNEKHFDKTTKHSAISQSKLISLESPEVEILDLTQSTCGNFFYDPNFHDSFYGGQLQFDDLNWRKFFNNLKPLGLAILMNNCFFQSICDYFKFYKHISNESMLQGNKSPVVKRRCLCQLAKLIGFSKNAIDNFIYENNIGIYKSLDSLRKDNNMNKLTVPLEQSNKLMLPFPHMVSNIFKDKLTGIRQAFSTGTADIIIDACVEYWDGKSLRPLDDVTRKKILDFYHRTSLTASCAAFSYTPLFNQHKFDDQFIEFPANNNNSKYNLKAIRSSDKLQQALDELTDQVFVGMVSMQYQAFQDCVRLIEQLEHACIRFVHFSRENELRSRIFSEKLGLESGWNCHISLQNNVREEPVATRQASLKQKSSKPQTSYHSDPDYIKMVLKSRQSVDAQSLNSWRSNQDLSFCQYRKEGSCSNLDRIGEDPAFPKTSSNDNDIDMDESLEQKISDKVEEDGEFESIAFDMANRAKLPRGIENIRPHLNTVDNVPLQVSLFTDCTPELTQEMVKIMQEYGEIVCVVGSSASKLNTGIFLQANASIAIEPLSILGCYSFEDKPENTHNSIPDEDCQSIESGSSSRKKPRAQASRGLSSSLTSSCSSSSSNSSTISVSDEDQSSLISSSSEYSSSLSEASNLDGSKHSDPDSDKLEVNADSSDACLCFKRAKKHLQSPTELASLIASLPCSYSFNRKEPMDLHKLIIEARHFTFKMKNTFICMICFALSLSSAQFLTSVLFLPPLYTSGSTIWLTVFVVPLLSFSLMGTTMDAQVAKIAVGKNLQLKGENIIFFVICYLIKFIPSIIVVVFNFGLIIAHSCTETGFGSLSWGPCWMFTFVRHQSNQTTPFNVSSSDSLPAISQTIMQNMHNKDDELDKLWSTHLLAAQVCAAFFTVLYLIVISAGFVHSSHLIWQRNPMRNYWWVAASLSLLLIQFLYSELILVIGDPTEERKSYEFIKKIPANIWIFAFSFPLLVLGINLLVKRAEIKAATRQQRRARFDFNTKLGMNSPF